MYSCTSADAGFKITLFPFLITLLELSHDLIGEYLENVFNCVELVDMRYG